MLISSCKPKTVMTYMYYILQDLLLIVITKNVSNCSFSNLSALCVNFVIANIEKIILITVGI